LRCDPLDPPQERSGHRGPFTDRALFDELVALEGARCLASGSPMPAGRLVNTWHLRFQIPRRDAPPLLAALRAFLQDGDEGPLRGYVRSPPGLRALPAPGEFWVS
jgi:hypothetical protein